MSCVCFIFFNKYTKLYFSTRVSLRMHSVLDDSCGVSYAHFVSVLAVNDRLQLE